jgi:hypothetical protein
MNGCWTGWTAKFQVEVDPAAHARLRPRSRSFLAHELTDRLAIQNGRAASAPESILKNEAFGIIAR